jgi:hypothetical protein
MSTPYRGQSGIEVHVANTGTAEAIGRALHALHLDGLMKYDLEHTLAVIHLDGQEIRQKLFTKHFVPCEPGEHKVGFFYWNFSALNPYADENWQAMWNEATTAATVEPGKVTLLEYTLRSLTVLKASIKVTGTRDA